MALRLTIKGGLKRKKKKARGNGLSASEQRRLDKIINKVNMAHKTGIPIDAEYR